jgi:predicted kinase
MDEKTNNQFIEANIMRRQKVVIFMGLPGSGKSTKRRELMAANSLKWVAVNKDSLRDMCHNKKFTKGNESFILGIRDFIILQALAAGKDVIVDDTNLDPKHEIRIREIVGDQADVIVDRSFLDVPLEVCLEQNIQRPNPVREHVIIDMYNRYIRVHPTPIVHDVNLPTAVIFDMDGTLSLLNGRCPFDTSTCENDLPNFPVVDLHRKYFTQYKIIIVSGRKDSCRQQTINWLNKHHIHFDEIFMRRFDDDRKDSIVKEEIFNEHIRGNFNIHLVVDDRKSVVDMWRSLGLTVFQVAEGNF